jgi:hypothetical protein
MEVVRAEKRERERLGKTDSVLSLCLGLSPSPSSLGRSLAVSLFGLFVFLILFSLSSLPDEPHRICGDDPLSGYGLRRPRSPVRRNEAVQLREKRGQLSTKRPRGLHATRIFGVVQKGAGLGHAGASRVLAWRERCLWDAR